MELRNNDKIEDIINSLINNNELQKAKDKCKRKLNKPSVLSLYIKILYLEGNKEKAIKLSKENIRYIPVVYEYIDILICENKYDEARTLCEKYLDRENINEKYIIILKHFNEYEKIDAIVNRYPYNMNIIKVYVNILKERKENDKLIKICNKFPHDKDLALLKKEITGSEEVSVYETVKKLINNKDYDEALRICDEHKEDRSLDDLICKIHSSNKVRIKYKLNTIAKRERVHKDVLNMIKKKNYSDAKIICKLYMEDSNILNMYLYILQCERVEKALAKAKKSYVYKKKNK